MDIGEQEFRLKWNNNQPTLIAVLDRLLVNQTLVDITLAAEGQTLKAHKLVLSACSPFFHVRFILPQFVVQDKIKFHTGSVVHCDEDGDFFFRFVRAQ